MFGVAFSLRECARTERCGVECLQYLYRLSVDYCAWLEWVWLLCRCLDEATCLLVHLLDGNRI